MTLERILLQKLAHGEGLPMPEKKSAGASGFDVVSANDSDIVLGVGDRCLVPTGLKLAIPDGWEIQVRPRSGLAIAHGITLLNTPGTIDSDYRGEVKIIIINLGKEPFTIKRGDRIAQLVPQRVDNIVFKQVSELPETDRGEGGFGHTGI